MTSPPPPVCKKCRFGIHQHVKGAGGCTCTHRGHLPRLKKE